MSATEHQKKEWVSAIKRDFPRLAGQEELIKMMVDVYSENPGFLQKLSRKLENQSGKEGKPKAEGPNPRFAAGELVGAVIISTPEVTNESDAERALSTPQEGGGGFSEVTNSLPPLNPL